MIGSLNKRIILQYATKDIVLDDSEWGEHDCKEIEIRDCEILLL